MRIFFAILAFSLVALISILGFRGTTFKRPPLEIFPDMDRQSRYNAQSHSDFFEDGRTDRPVPPGTVHRQAAAGEDDRLEDEHFRTGQIDGEYAEGFPMIVSRSLMKRGQDRYEIFCSACHGGVGDGQGITSEYGMAVVADFHTERLYEVPEGQIFETITDGRGLMGGYKDKLTPEDRWAVIAYMRALQRARLGTEDDVPGDRKAELGL